MTSDAFMPKFTVTDFITSSLTRIERARGFLEAATLSEEWIIAMGKRALVLEAHHTTHIEGTHLTEDEAERLWEGQEVSDVDPDDRKELLNYRKAFDLVSEYLGSGGPITEGLIREIQKRLVEGVRGGSAGPGRYREAQNAVVNEATGEILYTPPPPHDVPILMTQFVDWLNSVQTVHPVIVSGISQYQLVNIHPFMDGNGRTSRLLSTLYLYKTGYDFKRLFTISEYYDRDRAAFYRAIQSVRESNEDMTSWLEYYTKGLAAQLREVTRRGEHAIRQDVITTEQGLSKRQALALGYILEHGSLGIKDYERLVPEANRRTLQRDLKALVDKGLLVAEGATDRLTYSLKE